MKVMNGLVITLEEDKRFLCVWLFYYVSKYTKDFVEKIFTAMTNIFTAMPKKYLRLLCPMCQWSVARRNAEEE